MNLVEVLIVIMILAVAFTAFMGGIGQVLTVSSRSARLTDAVSRYEGLLFEVESGLRPDLAGYGGRGSLEGGFQYQIDMKGGGDFHSNIAGRLSWKDGKESLDFDLIVLRTGAQ